MKLTARGPEKIQPQLSRWAHAATPDDVRSVIVRLAFSTDPQELLPRVQEIGVQVESVASSSLVARVTPRSLEALGKLAGVLAIEEPRTLSLSSES